MTLDKIGIQNGIFLGIVLIIFNGLLSYLNPEIFIRTKSGVLIFPFVILIYKTGKDKLRLHNYQANFKQLLLSTMTCAIIGITLCSVFEYVQFNHLFPEYKEISKEIQLEVMESARSFLGDKFVEKNKALIENQNLHSLEIILSQMFWRYLFPGFVTCFFVSLILKRKKTKKNE